MRIRNIMMGNAVVLLLLAASSCRSFRNYQPLVYKTIHEAAQKGDLEDVKRHLENGMDVNAKDARGWTPLHYAADEGHKEVIALLISKGADVNIRNNKEWSPLLCAVAWGYKDVAELLIIKGADANDLGLALIEAVKWGTHMDIFELLIAKGTDVNTKDWASGKTPLHYAAKIGQVDVAKLLIAKGAYVNVMDRDGVTPLREASGNDMAELLIVHGAKR